MLTDWTTELAVLVDPTYELIKKKELKFGNITESRYQKVVHSGELHGLRSKISLGLAKFE